MASNVYRLAKKLQHAPSCMETRSPIVSGIQTPISIILKRLSDGGYQRRAVLIA
jgi:hypothetical protein